MKTHVEQLHEWVLNPKNMANLEAFCLVISSSIHLQFLKSYRLILSMYFMIERCFSFLKSAGLHSGIIFICKIRGQIMCECFTSIRHFTPQKFVLFHKVSLHTLFSMGKMCALGYRTLTYFRILDNCLDLLTISIFHFFYIIYKNSK